MRFRGRVLSVGALALVLLALPGSGFAANPNPFVEPASGPSVEIPGGPAVAPALVPGTTEGAIGTPDAVAYGASAGATVVTASVTSGTYEYNSTGSAIIAALGLPAGATLWQIDVYGYTTGVSAQSWGLIAQDDSTGGVGATGVTTSTGTGIVHGTRTFTGGLTLAAGQAWMVDLYATTVASGFVGAIFQYTLPTLSLVPITPTRVLDTRNGTGGLSGPFTNHVARTFQVTGGSTGVPAGARAVVGNLTVTGQTSNGYLFIGPVAMNDPTSSTLNFPAGDDRANAVTVGLSATGTLSITFVAPTTGPTAQAIFDVTGYYM